jgi:hypothetical protein
MVDVFKTCQSGRACLSQEGEKLAVFSGACVGKDALVEVAEDYDTSAGETVISTDSITSVKELKGIGKRWVLSSRDVRVVKITFEGSNVDDGSL